MSKSVFSPNEDKLCEEEFRNNDVLYDLSHPKYKNIIFKEESWKNISVKLEKFGEYKVKTNYSSTIL